MVGRSRILLCFVLIGFASLFIPRVSYTSVRSPYRYRSPALEVTLPPGWIYDDKLVTKPNGKRIFVASESVGERNSVWGVEILETETFGARTTAEFFANRKKRWTFTPKTESGGPAFEGALELDQATAHYIEWHGRQQDHLDVYVLAPNGKGWHLEFFTKHGQMDRIRPVFESITKSISFR